MDVLIFENGTHLDADALRSRFPGLTIHVTSDPAKVLEIAKPCEVLIALAHQVSDQLIAAMPKLRWIAALTTGTEHLQTLKNLRDDVIVTSARGIHGPQMSELAFLYMIALLRNFKQMQRNQTAGVWQRWPQQILLGKTIVIVGVGLIGEELAARCRAFGMHIVGVSDARTNARDFDEMLPRSKLKEAAAKADFLVALVPLSPATKHLIDDGVIAAMKPTAFLINIARGPVVDEQALIRHLQAGHIAGAGLDVFEHEPPAADSPLWAMPNVIVTPRIGGMSDRYAEQVLPLVVHNLQAYIEGRAHEMKNVVPRD
jgi:phosphoglycerate dehydrogenase-like enzyme